MTKKHNQFIVVEYQYGVGKNFYWGPFHTKNEADEFIVRLDEKVQEKGLQVEFHTRELNARD